METIHPNNYILEDETYRIGYIHTTCKEYPFGFFVQLKNNNDYIDKCGNENRTCGNSWHKSLKKALKAIEKHKGFDL